MSEKNGTNPLSRERSFVRTSKDQRRRVQTIVEPAIRGKPTVEIYRPPNLRTDLQYGDSVAKLNVHAKEFTMNHQQLQHPFALQPSKSSGDILHDRGMSHLQHSRSSGNVMRQLNNTGIIRTFYPIPVYTPAILNRVNFHPFPHAQPFAFPAPTIHQTNPPIIIHQQQPNLKRSKSLGSADSQYLSKLQPIQNAENMDLADFSIDDRKNLQVAIVDPNQLPSRTLMDLVKIIMEKVIEGGVKLSETGAKLCISIIEREKTHTFLETLLNTCQQWYQERDKVLRDTKPDDWTKFIAFVWFMTEMCGLLKRHQLREQSEDLQPGSNLLSILLKCCELCLYLPINNLPGTECLFFVLTSIGRDLESEMPEQFEQLLTSVRDGFLANSTSPQIRRTLLQLIELHASDWQLAGSSVLYYYPRIR